jgi:[ribosomal protein S18]-alanine N-acetyltransferase
LSGVRVQRLRWWQIDELMPIEADLFGTEKWSPGMFWNELAAGHLYLAAVDDTGAVAGYAGLALSLPDEGWINNVAVRRDAQRQGIARTLIAQLLDFAMRSGVKAVLLEVAADNEPAQALYAAFGFARIGVRKGYYQPTNTDAYVMRVEL